MKKLVQYLMDEMKNFTVAVNTKELKVLRFLEYYVDDSDDDKGVWLTIEVSYRNRGRNKYSVSVIDRTQIDGDGRLVYMIYRDLLEHELMDIVKRIIHNSTWGGVVADK